VGHWGVRVHRRRHQNNAEFPEGKTENELLGVPDQQAGAYYYLDPVDYLFDHGCIESGLASHGQ